MPFLKNDLQTPYTLIWNDFNLISHVYFSKSELWNFSENFINDFFYFLFFHKYFPNDSRRDFPENSNFNIFHENSTEISKMLHGKSMKIFRKVIPEMFLEFYWNSVENLRKTSIRIFPGILREDSVKVEFFSSSLTLPNFSNYF